MNLEEILGRLNKEQREAALDIEGPSMVIAGPGSGKTFTLIARTANMIANGIPAKDIILFTFTKKAANEIKERVINIIGEQGKYITVGTYHSVCCRLLRKHAPYVGLTKSFTIYDEEDASKVMKEAIKESGYEIEYDTVKFYVSDLKCRLISYQEAARMAEHKTEKHIADIYRRYETKLLSNNAVDFDNLIYKMVRLMENHHDIKTEINTKYKYIVADESHDSSVMDLRLIELLAGDTENICMILDNDQSIYAFRGAEITAVMNMVNVFTNTRTHLLNTNYRSTETIVEASKSLISNNTKFIEKQLKSNGSVGNPIVLFEEQDNQAEAEKIIGIIRMCKDKFGMNYKDIAVLYRMNYLSRAIEEQLLKHRVPYKIIGGTMFYARKEVKDIMSYFKLIFNPDDRVAFERALSNPKRGIGDKAMEAIFEYSSVNRVSLIEALQNVKLTTRARAGADAFLEVINDVSANLDNEEAADSIGRLIEGINYVEYIKNSESKSVFEDKIDNLRELQNISYSFESIEDFTANITLSSEVDVKDEEDKDEVQLLTIHSSKGLEWKAVIMTNMVDGIMPSIRATSDAEKQEERRVAYIGMTRAKELLFLTRPKFTIRQGNYIYAKPSPFISEINQEYLKRFNSKKS